MDKVNYNKPEQETKPQADDQSVMFRWILLILMSVAAKVLNKTEVMNIYTLVRQTIGHSQSVDGLHSELIGMMGFEKKLSKTKYYAVTKDGDKYYVWDKLGATILGSFDNMKEAKEWQTKIRKEK